MRLQIIRPDNQCTPADRALEGVVRTRAADRRFGSGAWRCMAPVDVGPASLPSCWALAASYIAVLLTAAPALLFSPAEVDWRAISQETPAPDMLRPRGEWVGVQEADAADDEDD